MKKIVLLITLLINIVDVKSQTVTELGFFAPLINTADVKYVNNHLIVAQQGMKIFDVSNPANPFQSSAISYPGSGNSPHQLAVQGTMAVLSQGGGGYFSVYNISNFSSPVLLGSTVIPSSEFVTGGDMLIKGTTAYMVAVDSLYIIDISNPSAPVNTSTLQVVNLPPFGSASTLAYDGNSLFVLHSIGISVYDISNPLTPLFLTSIALTHQYHNGLVTDTINHRLFSPWNSVLQTHLGYDAYDVSTPATPSLLFADSISGGGGEFGNCDYYNNTLIMTRGGGIEVFNTGTTHNHVIGYLGPNVANSGVSVCIRDSVFYNGRRGGFEILKLNGILTASEENYKTPSINIYPNPVQAGSELVLSGDDNNYILEVTSLAGQLILRKQLNNLQEQHLRIPKETEPGIYFISMQSENSTVTKRISVN